MRTFAEMAENVIESGWTRCYIAIIPGEDGNYHLEIEVRPHDIICGEWDVGTDILEQARDQADELAHVLTMKGVFVYYTREEWERYTHDETIKATP
jgi:hypothetical protein